VAGPRSAPLLPKPRTLLAKNPTNPLRFQITGRRPLQRGSRQNRYHLLVRHLPENGRKRGRRRRAKNPATTPRPKSQHGRQHPTVQTRPFGHFGMLGR
jgi:hypothetical protein